MDEEMNSSEIAYPSEEVLAKGEVFQYLDSETTHLMDSLWLQVKTEAGDSTDYTPIIGILTVVVLVGGGVAFSWIRDRRRRANRCRKWTNV